MKFYFNKFFKKIHAYFYYLANKNSRKYFFILISRKFKNLFKTNLINNSNVIITKWCKEKKIFEKNFYQKIGLKSERNFFLEHRSFYISARLKEKKLNYKMGGMAHLNLIYNLVLCFKPKEILETGVAFGWSTLVFIISKQNNSNLTSIDLNYPTKDSEKLVGMAVPSNLKKKYKLMMGIDNYYLKNFYEQKKFFDFIHYDSDKSYDGRKKNYDLIWKILNKNGCFISDDISDNSAFYEFILSKKLKYYILELNNKFVGVIFK